MQFSKRQFALSSVLALILYFVPNLVQDVHRILGHHEYHYNSSIKDEKHFNTHYDKCAVCIFEFNVVDQLKSFIYLPVLQAEVSLFVEKHENQIQNKVFQYYNLRAPPQA